MRWRRVRVVRWVDGRRRSTLCFVCKTHSRQSVKYQPLRTVTAICRNELRFFSVVGERSQRLKLDRQAMVSNVAIQPCELTGLMMSARRLDAKWRWCAVCSWFQWRQWRSGRSEPISMSMSVLRLMRVTLYGRCVDLQIDWMDICYL